MCTVVINTKEISSMKKKKGVSGNSLGLTASISSTEKKNVMVFEILRQRMSLGN